MNENKTIIEQWPQAKIVKIEPSGLLSIKFAQRMKVPDNLALLKNGIISVNETEYPFIDLELVPGKFTDLQKSKFNWTIINFEPFQLKI